MLYGIAFRVGTKSYLVKCEHGLRAGNTRKPTLAAWPINIEIMSRVISLLNFSLQLLSYGTPTRGKLLPYKSYLGARRKISRTPLLGTRILFYWRVPNSFPPLRGTNSTTTNYITGTKTFFRSITLGDNLPPGS